MGIFGWKTARASGVTRRRADEAVAADGCASAWRYLAILAMTIALTAAGFVGVVIALDAAGRRPPPAFSNSYCLDAKLAWLRENPPQQPTHLILGSSISWRNVSAETISMQNPNASPLNIGLCGLSMNQSAFTGRFFLERFPSVTDVLLVLDPFDMHACPSKMTAVFDGADVSAYLSGENDLHYYFRYFDIFSLIVNAFSAPDPVTPFGDGPLLRDYSQGVGAFYYGAAPAVQPACEKALAEFANDVQRRGKHLVVMTMPLLGDWSDKYDGNSVVPRQLAESIRRSLHGTSATFWDAWSKVALPRSDYFDAVHLHWRAVPGFTRQLVQATGFGAAAD